MRMKSNSHSGAEYRRWLGLNTGTLRSLPTTGLRLLNRICDENGLVLPTTVKASHMSRTGGIVCQMSRGASASYVALMDSRVMIFRIL